MKVRAPIPIAAVAAIGLGGIAWAVSPRNALAMWIWTLGLIATAIPVVSGTVRGVIRGKFGADLVATLTVVVALVLGHPVVGLVIVLMQTGGEALERFAAGKASEALKSLQENAPQQVHRITDGAIIDVDASAVSAGDMILVRPGEMIPCDGEVVSGNSHIDTSTLTGEPIPQEARAGTMVMSGGINQESPLTIRTTAPAEESQYARIVALVREAQTSKAPLQRIADRFAVWFTPLTIAGCVAAYSLSHDWERVLAVLAIATPCPLILATPVAILGGMNSAARRQVLIRNGGALEVLSRITAVVFDKTGTITIGRPSVSSVISLDSIPERELLQLAGAVEQGSGHLLARTVVHAAEQAGLGGTTATAVVEAPGRGVEGQVGPDRVAVGARSYISERYPRVVPDIAAVDTHRRDATLRAYIAVNGELKGLIEYADVIREGMDVLVRRLHDAGVAHVLLLSGDRSENTRAIAKSVGIEEWRGDLLPEHKVEVVNRLTHDGEIVAMIGDGTNDAPALSAASVGVALASHGRGIATEAADVILLADDPSRLLDVIRISKRTMRIARQSIWAGLTISVIGMVFAAAGQVVPIAGAAIQELVDLGVILNALRASRSMSYGKV